MAIDTRKVAGRRKLRFNSLDDILADLNSLEGKRLKTLGNWSVGQILVHIAVTMNCAIDGTRFSFPWYFRVMGWLFKSHFLNGSMPAGFQFSKEAAAQLSPAPTTDADGFAAVRKAIQRLKSETHREPNAIMGRLNIDEWNQMNCRHAELHLSFIVPEDAR